MKNRALIAGVLIAILNGLLFVSGFEAYGTYLIAGSLTLALWLVLKAMTDGDATPAFDDKKGSAPQPKPAPVATPPAPKNVSEAEVVAVLAALQSKGRLVDFLMDDISSCSDAQVGAAARVVHQGCKAAFSEMFSVEPVASEREGSTITVPQNARDSYRFFGTACGVFEQSGKLVHKGWKATRVNLPRVVALEPGVLPVIAPAQVQVK